MGLDVFYRVSVDLARTGWGPGSGRKMNHTEKICMVAGWNNQKDGYRT